MNLADFNSPNVDQSGRAYAMSYQNEHGYWLAIRPVQNTWSGYKTESEALAKVGAGDQVVKSLVSTCGKFYVYKLDYDYKSFHNDVHEQARKKGYSCSW